MRILYIAILIAIIFIIVFFNIRRIQGKIAVTINGHSYQLDYLKCTYNKETDGEDGITYESKSSDLIFKNKGSKHGMYEYTFVINNEEINIEPQIRVFKTDWWRILNLKINVNIYKSDEVWNADVSVDVNGRMHYETFYDIERNVIEYRVE